MFARPACFVEAPTTSPNIYCNPTYHMEMEEFQQGQRGGCRGDCSRYMCGRCNGDPLGCGVYYSCDDGGNINSSDLSVDQDRVGVPPGAIFLGTLPTRPPPHLSPTALSRVLVGGTAPTSRWSTCLPPSFATIYDGIMLYE